LTRRADAASPRLSVSRPMPAGAAPGRRVRRPPGRTPASGSRSPVIAARSALRRTPASPGRIACAEPAKRRPLRAAGARQLLGIPSIVCGPRGA
jgi:hypothetical protein